MLKPFGRGGGGDFHFNISLLQVSSRHPKRPPGQVQMLGKDVSHAGHRRETSPAQAGHDPGRKHKRWACNFQYVVSPASTESEFTAAACNTPEIDLVPLIFPPSRVSSRPHQRPILHPFPPRDDGSNGQGRRASRRRMPKTGNGGCADELSVRAGAAGTGRDIDVENGKSPSHTRTLQVKDGVKNA